MIQGYKWKNFPSYEEELIWKLNYAVLHNDNE